MNKNTVEVYWAPAPFVNSKESWNLLYPEPELVKNKLHSIRTDFDRGFFSCPVTRENLNNLYSLKSSVTDVIDLPVEYLKQIHMKEGTEKVPSFNRQIVSLNKERPSSLKGYSNLSYNLSWLFFASEPLNLRLSAPFYPTKTPSDGAFLFGGEMDIGEWFRPINLDYHVPLESTTFSVQEGDELAYIKFVTTKKVVLKRFILNDTLHSLSLEMTNASLLYNKFQPIIKRYEMAKASKIKNIILKEIKNNLVE
jgi:hypothetical protein